MQEAPLDPNAIILDNLVKMNHGLMMSYPPALRRALLVGIQAGLSSSTVPADLAAAKNDMMRSIRADLDRPSFPKLVTGRQQVRVPPGAVRRTAGLVTSQDAQPSRGKTLAKYVGTAVAAAAGTQVMISAAQSLTPTGYSAIMANVVPIVLNFRTVSTLISSTLASYPLNTKRGVALRVLYLAVVGAAVAEMATGTLIAEREALEIQKAIAAQTEGDVVQQSGLRAMIFGSASAALEYLGMGSSGTTMTQLSESVRGTVAFTNTYRGQLQMLKDYSPNVGSFANISSAQIKNASDTLLSIADKGTDLTGLKALGIRDSFQVVAQWYRDQSDILLFHTMANIVVPDVWNGVKSQYRRITGQSTEQLQKKVKEGYQDEYPIAKKMGHWALRAASFYVIASYVAPVVVDGAMQYFGSYIGFGQDKSAKGARKKSKYNMMVSKELKKYKTKATSQHQHQQRFARAARKAKRDLALQRRRQKKPAQK